MITFSLIAGGLLVLALLATAWPLLKSRDTTTRGESRTELNLSIYRDQLAELDRDRLAGTLDEEHYEQARADLRRRLLEEVPDAEAPVMAAGTRRSYLGAMTLVVAVPTLAVWVYLALGSPASLWPGSETQLEAESHGVSAQQVDAMVRQLAARLENNPQDGDGWVLLARSNAALGRFEAASSAYAKSMTFYPDNAQLLADYADALGMAQGRSLRGEPEKLIERALQHDPDNVKALALSGTIAFENKEFAAAVKRWERAQALLPPGSELAKSIQASISEAQSLKGGGSRARP